MTKLPKPKLVQCANTWSMIGWPRRSAEWSESRKLAAIKEAGFEGVAAAATPALGELAGRCGLAVMGGVLAVDFRRAAEEIRMQRLSGAGVINIQLLRHDTRPIEAAKLAARLMALSDRIGACAHVETHRDTATETPEKMTEIARLYRRITGKLLPVTWDHSHLAVMKHIQPEHFRERLLAWPELIQHSRLFHLRPFNAQHCQVAVTDARGRLTPEFRDYLGFVEELFGLWLRGPRPGGALWTCPELGMTHGYHVSTNPHVWPDVIRAREEYAAIWARAVQQNDDD